jgi:hypothetical protein
MTFAHLGPPLAVSGFGTEPYAYTDIDGDRLEIQAEALAATVNAWGKDGGHAAVLVPAERRAEVAAALWPEGQAPIILDRVAINPRTGYHQHGWSVTLHEDGRVYVKTNRDFAPDDALVLAAVIAAYAQHARDEPDPAEVEALAACIADESSHPGGDYTNSTPEQIARLVLRRFKTEERAQ